MNQNQRRAFFYGMGGVYLIYLAYRMCKEQTAAGGMEPGLLIATVGLFAIAGAGLLLFAIWIAKKEADEEKKKERDESETDRKRVD